MTKKELLQEFDNNKKKIDKLDKEMLELINDRGSNSATLYNNKAQTHYFLMKRNIEILRLVVE